MVTMRNHLLSFCHTPRLIGLCNVQKHNVTSNFPMLIDNWLSLSVIQADISLARYDDVYEDGPYALRERRLKKLAEMGIIDKSVLPHEVETTTVGADEWEDLTSEGEKPSSRAMQT